MTALAAALDALPRTCAAFDLPWQLTWRAPLSALCDAVAAGARATNLVGDPSAEGVCAHVVEALAVVACAHDLGHKPLVVADIGAGAGLAALTYALAWPQAQVFAVEPRNLRADFIRTAASACGLIDRVVVVQRSLSASLASGALPAALDLADARAVWPAAQWVARAAPLVGSKGLIALHVRAGDASAEFALTQWQVHGRRAVPGPRGYAVALVRA